MTNCVLWRGGAITCLFCSILQPLISAAQGDVLTYHNDNARTGQYLTETNLTLANVNSNSFGLLFSQPVDAPIWGQPLFVSGVSITNKGTHNVVFVATGNDSVYAFDADNNSGSNAVPLWQVSFLSPSNGVTAVPGPDVFFPGIIGVSSTPVIDPVSHTIYVEAQTKEVSATAVNYVHRLHALDLGSGQEKFGGPVVVSGSVPGMGDGNDGAGNVPFSGYLQLNRPALLLANGVVYLGFAGHADAGNYHGWLLGYNAQTLQPQGIYNSSPNGWAGGIWQSGDGPCVDENGAIYAMTGNGTFDGTTNSNYGDSVVKISNDGTNMIQTDSFTPFNQSILYATDGDMGSGGPMLLPDETGTSATPHLMVGGGKDGIFYLFDRDNLGQFNADFDQVVDEIDWAGAQFSTPAYFNGMIYICGVSRPLQAVACTNAALGQTPTAASPEIFGTPGATPYVSANGKSNAIVWALQYTGSAVLHAYNATNIADELYNSSQAGSRDVLAVVQKNAPPAVAHGKVYVPTASGLAFFGIGFWSAPPVISPNSGLFTNSVTVTISSDAGGTQIYYTLDGTGPSISSTLYTAPFTLTNATEVRAIAATPGGGQSSVSEALYLPAVTNAAIVDFDEGWTLNGGATVSTNGLTVTDGGYFEGPTAFFSTPVYAGAFDAEFIYQATGIADGMAFVLQDATNGANAVGIGYQGLGYLGLAPSVAVEFNFYSYGRGIGTALAENGSVGPYYSTGSVGLNSGDPIWVSLHYDGTVFSETLEDPITGGFYTTNILVSIPSILGTNTAFVGFTGGTEEYSSVQTVSDFVYTELPPPAPPPLITPNGAFFTNSVMVTLSSPYPGARYYYTVDGTTPGTNSILYAGPIQLTNTTALRAVTEAPGLSPGFPGYAFFGAQSVGTGITAFGGSGTGWTLNGSASANGDVLQLTDTNYFEAGSAFFDTPLAATNFVARFLYEATGGTNAADGVAFVLQNSPNGPSALGGSSEYLGLTGISPSVGLELHLLSYTGGSGTQLGINGASSSFNSTLPLDLTSGDPIWVSLIYDGATLQEKLVDPINGNSYAASYAIDIAGILGTSRPWIGFSGSDTFWASVQTISDFTFSPQFAAPTVSATFSGTQITLNWNASPVNYIVECTTNLGNPTIWTPVSQPPVVSGNQLSLSLPIGTTNTFFRLRAP